MVLAAPSEVALQNSRSLQLRRKHRPRWGLDAPLVQEEVEKVQVQLALSFFHHQPLIAADSSSRLDVGPMSGGTACAGGYRPSLGKSGMFQLSMC